MSFSWPSLLWLLALVPVVIAAYIWSQKRRKKYAVRFASLSIVKEALGKGPGFRRHIPPILFIAALALLVFGLARPNAVVPLLSDQGVIILAIDSSGSMRADDVKPSRMEAAKAAAKAFIEKQPAGARIGIVTFAATASVVQPPTDSKEDLLAAVDRLTMQRGTAIGSGIVVSLNTILEDFGDSPIPFQFGGPGAGQGGFGGYDPYFGGGGFGGGENSGGTNPDLERAFEQSDGSQIPAPSSAKQYNAAIVVLLSDGQSNTGPQPLDVVEQASARKVRIYTVGLGDPNGVILNYFNRSARVSLDEATLKSIAEKTYGSYQRASTDTDLRTIYENLSTELVIKPEKIELTALFAAAAAILLLGAAGLSLVWFNRLP